MEAEGRLPDLLIAAVGGGSNAIGLFHPFLDDPDVAMIGVEAAGHGHRHRPARRQPRRRQPRHPPRQQDLPAAGRGRPDHRGALDQRRARLSGHRPRAQLAARERPGRAICRSPTGEALDAFQLCCKLEGIIPALESAHALATARTRQPEYGEDQIILVNVSGRGDKDIFTVAEALGENWGEGSGGKGRWKRPGVRALLRGFAGDRPNLSKNTAMAGFSRIRVAGAVATGGVGKVCVRFPWGRGHCVSPLSRILPGVHPRVLSTCQESGQMSPLPIRIRQGPRPRLLHNRG